MRRFHHVAFEIIIAENSATNGRNTNGSFANAEFFQNFSNQTMNDPMRTAWTIVEGFAG